MNALAVLALGVIVGALLVGLNIMLYNRVRSPRSHRRAMRDAELAFYELAPSQTWGGRLEAAIRSADRT